MRPPASQIDTGWLLGAVRGEGWRDWSMEEGEGEGEEENERERE